MPRGSAEPRAGAPRRGRSTQLADSGYARLARRLCLLADCAPVGPDYLPAHAHADTLSFELSLGGRRVLVNSGTSEYGDRAERARASAARRRTTRSRSTARIRQRSLGRLSRRASRARRACCGRATARAGAARRTRWLSTAAWPQPASPPLAAEDRIIAHRRLGERQVRTRRGLLSRASRSPARQAADHQFELALPDSRRLSLRVLGAASTALRPGPGIRASAASWPTTAGRARFAGAQLHTRLG